ncbi:MAG TPA: MFS transporter, partial [Candidatus Angelobacter sp.]|nr:MFS transporter [Candidatus Angelobacter sp.]
MSAASRQGGWRRSYWALNITQFQGAFSANAFQNLLSYMVLGMELTHEQRDKMVPLILLFFSVPLVLFSMTGGFLADRFSKRQVIIWTKLIEIAAMAAGIIALGTGYFPLQLAVLFVVATQAALFGPSKYGLLPEILPEKLLSWGNGILELLTFLAIISGNVAAGLMSERFPGHAVYAFALLLVLACCGLVSSLGIAKV